ncbi:MAG: hypothetical protein IKN73_02120 [Alphaproteobacteria bacterium]|nr:hypothetical protein [Alphaproteobacteria bacterium]
MRKFLITFLSVFLCVNFVNAATVRSQNAVVRSETTNTSVRQKNTTKARSTISRIKNQNTRTNNSIKRVSARTATNQKVISGRIGTTQKVLSGRNIKTQNSKKARATATTKTFGTSYNDCRDAYFSCMDQFCATQNETYRRCVCSSKLKNIQEKEQKLSNTANSLKDFQDFNIDAISKTAAEVTAMSSASEGEQAIKKDTSDSANTLSNISSVLNTTKQKSLSTQGTLDIGGNMKSVWGTTDLIGGSDIANMTGESLYNAVHTQCAEMVTENCTSSNLTMVASAYGMYIENDCTLLEASIKSKTTEANAAIRTTRHNMQDARYDNYNAHNSLSLNDCISKVRQDITSNTACGTNYIHCLDVTGKYLNSTTGEPIYSNEFFQISNQISLSGDVLNNNANKLFIDALDKKRPFAKTTLELCEDNSDYVWKEFLQQALVEIYQGQLSRVQSVKAECLQVVNECYDEQTGQLKEFSNDSDKISLGLTLEVAEDMCKEKLTACSNLYGGGSEGLSLLVNTMRDITDKTIGQSCKDLLIKYTKDICAVPNSDSEHSYPYGCRTFDPGESLYAKNGTCNSTLVNPFIKNDIVINTSSSNIDFYLGFVETDKYYGCYTQIEENQLQKAYTSCNSGYYMYSNISNAKFNYSGGNDADECRICPSGYTCLGGTSAPQAQDSTLYTQCGTNYIGSLYHKMVRYALQNCLRSSSESTVLPEYILSDVNIVMNQVQYDLVKELSSECEKQKGLWVDLPWQDENADGIHDANGDKLSQAFYAYTGTSILWGYCKAQ